MAGTINRTMEFGVPIFDIELGDFEQHRQALIDHFLDMRGGDSGASRSNRGGWHSGDDLYRSDHPSVQWLVRNLFQAAEQCVRQSGYYPDDQAFAMTACWVNVNEAGDWNAPHSHLPDIWSGVCYIDLHDPQADSARSRNDGDIIFFNPLGLGPEHNRAATVSAQPQVGKAFLFPSYLLHMVAPHFDDKARISVAFNMKFRPRQG